MTQMKTKVLLTVILLGMLLINNAINSSIKREERVLAAQQGERARMKKQVSRELLVERAASLIASFEGFRSTPYKCAKGQWTIGYGDGRSLNNTNTKRREKKVAMTKEEARRGLQHRVRLLVGELEEELFKHNPTLSQKQRIAIISIADNMGIGRFKKTDLFTIIKHRGNKKQVIQEWVKYNKVTIRGQLKTIKGLSNEG